MQWTQLHLALNHLPVMGVPFLLVLLMWGMFRRSTEIIRLSHAWIVLLCALSIALKFTGDFAAEEAKDRLSGSKVWMERHEQSADQATTGLFLLGVSSAVGWGIGRRREHMPTWANWTALGLGLMTGILLGRAAHLGGQISHPNLRVMDSQEIDVREKRR